MGFAGDRRLQVVAGAAERQAGGRIADRLQVFEMAVGVAGFAFGGGTEYRGDVVVAFDVGLLREIQITTIGLGFAGERGFQIAFGFGTFEGHGRLLLRVMTKPGRAGTERA